MKNNHGTVSNIRYALKLIRTCSPHYLLWEIVYGILLGIWGSAAVVFTQIFYNALFEDGDFPEILRIVGIMLILTVLSQFWSQWYTSVFRPKMRARLQYGVNRILFEKNAELDLDCYNNPEFYNDFVWAMSECDSQLAGVVDSISNTFQHVLAFVISSGVMASVSPVLAIVAVLTSIMHIVLQRFWIKSDLKRKLALTPLNRKNAYYESLFNTPDYAKDMRTSRVSEILSEKYTENQKQIKDTHIKYNSKLLKYIIPFNLLSGIMQPIVYGILFYQIIVQKTLGMAALAVAFTAFWSLRYRIQGVIDLFLKYSQHGLYIGQIRKYMSYCSAVRFGDIAAPAFQSMELKNVSFGYVPGKTVLSNISMKINRGEKIAIVGYNGAGKSTLISLLLHLYNPEQGEILYNGKSIEEFDSASIHSRIGVVLQDYRIFALPLSENVLRDKFEESDESRIRYALENACFESKLQTLPDGICSEMTKEFYKDGVNLSGGESQKVAISRIFASPFDVIIMDEPSAALDPKAEHDLSINLAKHSKEKTVIIISHRLSTTCAMDKIYMFDGGKIIEEGSHSELMEAGGKYAQIFNMQAEKYQ